MKIAYISKSIVPSRSANSLQVVKMCEALAKIGHKVTLYCHTSGDNKDKAYSYYGITKCFKIKNRIFTKYKELKWIRNNKNQSMYKKELPDLFYGRDDLENFLKAAPLGKPIILEVHEPPKNSATKKNIEKLISYKNFKYLVVTSNALRKEYLKIFPNLTKKIVVAHNGSDIPDTLQNKNEKITLPGHNTKIKIGYIGHLYPGKGIEMIEQLAARLPDIDFHVIGGTDEDLERCKKTIKNKNIIFHGFIQHNQLGKYYNAFDIVLAPYQNKVKTFGGSVDNSKWICPLKIFDYMAHAKPIVVSDTILKDVLTDRVNCLTCPATDVDAWQNAILKLINSPELRTKLANAAYKDFIEHYTWIKRAQKISKLFHVKEG